MKIKPILTAMAVAFAAIAQPAVAEFTQNQKGEVTHHNGIPLPPIPTVEEARAQAEKSIAATKAREAEQAQQLATRNPSPATPPQEVFFTGKPYIEETGQYAFLFRHYDPELSRWTTADPSGFPDGANNSAYMAVPTTEFDWQGLKSVAFLYGWYDPTNSTVWESTSGLSGTWRDSDFNNHVDSLVSHMNQRMTDADSASGSKTHYIDDGDYLTFGALTSWTQLSGWEGTYDKVYVVAHGAIEGPEVYTVNGIGWAPGTWGQSTKVWGCNPVQGSQDLSRAGTLYFEIADFLRE